MNLTGLVVSLPTDIIAQEHRRFFELRRDCPMGRPAGSCSYCSAGSGGTCLIR
jgi:hypothetical protein